jgi:hypothetical protein
MGQKRTHKHRTSSRKRDLELILDAPTVNMAEPVEDTLPQYAQPTNLMGRVFFKLDQLRTLHVIAILFVTGIIVYGIGLKNRFLGDDALQIVNNPPVHSIVHIKLFFEGGTFYVGNGLHPLGGVYFRPLMTTVYSIIYTIFGAHPFYFHLIQLLLFIGSSAFVYLIFRFSFKPSLALLLALIFLVHPINSQAVFEISTMQDTLFFFFGILGMYILFQYKSIESLIGAACCLFLSLLAKETAVVFVFMGAMYLYWYNRKRLGAYCGITLLPIIVWLILKIHAVGLLGSNPHNAPIDELSLTGRLMTSPSILLFYITKFIFPWKLASVYYWVHPTFSIKYVLFPLIIDLVVIGFAVYGAYLLYQKSSKAMYYTYVFFGIWAATGTLTTLQILPLDATASTTWFYFSMVGVLGMLGIVLKTFEIDQANLLWIMLAIILLLGIRTVVRGPNYASNDTLAFNDIKSTNSDYVAYGLVSQYYFYDHKDLPEALKYGNKSIAIFPSGSTYNTLCTVYFSLNQREQAERSCIRALRYPQTRTGLLYSSTALLMLLNGNSQSKQLQFILAGLKEYPRNANLWLYLAVIQYQDGNVISATSSIGNAANYGNNKLIEQVKTIISKREKLSLGS